MGRQATWTSVICFIWDLNNSQVSVESCVLQPLTFNDHNTKVVSSCNYHIQSRHHIRQLIANTLACSTIITRLDYCNSLLCAVTNKNIMRHQHVQNSLARAVCAGPYHGSSSSLLQSSHWLPTYHRINYNSATLPSRLLYHPPSYQFNMLHSYTHLVNCSPWVLVFYWSRLQPWRWGNVPSPLQQSRLHMICHQLVTETVY